MAWLYEKSQGWRMLVHVTKHSKPMMGLFTVTVGVVIPTGLWYGIQSLTNPELSEEQQKKLKASRQDVQVMARVNKERLATLLSEVENRNSDVSEDRYRISLQGKTLGTSAGSSLGVGAIDKKEDK